MMKICNKKSINRFFYTILICTIFTMFIGCITRLYKAGLSIVQWDLFIGIIPPLSEKTWNIYYESYKQFPEFLHNPIDFLSFKDIFWLEYWHRICARLTGITAIYFALIARSRDSLIICILVGLQGVLGWLMVRTGLKNIPMVDNVYLAAHFVGAIAIVVFCIRKIFSHNIACKKMLGLSLLTGFYGALVAGLKAGKIYNTFPLMNGHLLPDGILALNPIMLNFFYNHGTVQFIHRILAIAIILYAIYKKDVMIIVIATLQATIGIVTLLLSVPIFFASLHQLCGCLLIIAISIGKSNSSIRSYIEPLRSDILRN